MAWGLQSNSIQLEGRGVCDLQVSIIWVSVRKQPGNANTVVSGPHNNQHPLDTDGGSRDLRRCSPI